MGRRRSESSPVIVAANGCAARTPREQPGGGAGVSGIEHAGGGLKAAQPPATIVTRRCERLAAGIGPIVISAPSVSRHASVDRQSAPGE
jgi:hypothetical protein